MSFHFFALISRMRYITRWGLMRNTFSENVQEHSHMTAVLAHGLALIRREIFGKQISPDQVAALALYHDAPEILIGDLPTPVKYYNPAIRDAYKQVERISASKLLSMLPDTLRGPYETLLSEGDSELFALVKAADKLAAYIKCVEELKAGNNEFRQAADQIWTILHTDPLPETTYFIQHFLPSFSLTLDELN